MRRVSGSRWTLWKGHGVTCQTMLAMPSNLFNWFVLYNEPNHKTCLLIGPKWQALVWWLPQKHPQLPRPPCNTLYQKLHTWFLNVPDTFNIETGHNSLSEDLWYICIIIIIWLHLSNASSTEYVQVDMFWERVVTPIQNQIIEQSTISGPNY